MRTKLYELLLCCDTEPITSGSSRWNTLPCLTLPNRCQCYINNAQFHWMECLYHFCSWTFDFDADTGNVVYLWYWLVLGMLRLILLSIVLLCYGKALIHLFLAFTKLIHYALVVIFTLKIRALWSFLYQLVMPLVNWSYNIANRLFFDKLLLSFGFVYS
jgi:hypothetical protein